MENWYEVTAKCERTLENGTEKKVNEKYLVAAVSVSDAEATVADMLGGGDIGGNLLEISSAAQKPISEVFGDGDGDKWFKAKVMFITLDEKTGAEKKVARIFMVKGSDFESAYKAFKEGMKGTMSDWELHTLQETAIIDVVFGNNDRGC